MPLLLLLLLLFSFCFSCFCFFPPQLQYYFFCQPVFPQLVFFFLHIIITVLPVLLFYCLVLLSFFYWFLSFSSTNYNYYFLSSCSLIYIFLLESFVYFLFSTNTFFFTTATTNITRVFLLLPLLIYVHHFPVHVLSPFSSLPSSPPQPVHTNSPCLSHCSLVSPARVSLLHCWRLHQLPCSC